jgi:hypothetical protein
VVRYGWLALAVAVAGACSGGNDDARAPAAPDSVGATSTGGNKAPAQPDPGEDAGAGGAVPSQGGASGGEGGGIVYEEDEPPVFEPGVCDPMMAPGDAETQSLGVGDVTLLAMTHDELSVAFVTGGAPDQVLYVADRSASNGAFSEQQVTIPAGYYAERGASFSSDGTRLILVKQDNTGFGELTRAERGEAFGAEADETRFAYLNMLSATTGQKLGWPVATADDEALYFVSIFCSSHVEYSQIENGVFKLGQPIDEFTLGGPEGEFKLLTGIASDERAIFFFDQASGQSQALFRQDDGAPFYDPVDLGQRQGVAPNADCTRVYSSFEGSLVLQSIE